MSYRYPFTPFPKSWFRIEVTNQKAFAFGRELKLEKSANGSLILSDANNPKRIFPVVQKNESFYAFYDEQGDDPYFEVPFVSEFQDTKNWQPPFYHYWRVRVHVQEIAENAVDLSHFCVVHTYQQIPVLNQLDIFNHQFKLSMCSRRKLLGKEGKITMNICYHGMGIVTADVLSFGDVTLKVLLTMTPTDQEWCDIYLGTAIKKTPSVMKNLFLRWLIRKDVKSEFTRDLPIWKAKIYQSKPVLCANEGNIIRIRKWATQFYS